MVTISQITKKIIESRPTLQEALIEDVISFANLAEKLQPRIEKEIGHKVKASAINMSIRRYAETNQIITCPDCGSELEVTGPDAVKPAPQEEEDWGE